MKNLRLKSARAALDMSQQQLADAVGVSRQTINAIEKGDYNPTIRLGNISGDAVALTLEVGSRGGALDARRSARNSLMLTKRRRAARENRMKTPPVRAAFSLFPAL